MDAGPDRLARVPEGDGDGDGAGLDDVDRRPDEGDGEDRADKDEEAFPRARAKGAVGVAGSPHTDEDEPAVDTGAHAVAEEPGERGAGLHVPIARIPDHATDGCAGLRPRLRLRRFRRSRLVAAVAFCHRSALLRLPNCPEIPGGS